ncbi:MAG: sigma-54-dependent Fis family transcriptional regulator [Melioribacteraceae bacterium]|nr:MAG: sigma-54-dependent Fis family transcriptional regulator [Melioribacteraceae bacterium]
MSANFTDFTTISELSGSHFDSLYKISQILNSSEYTDTLIESALDIVIESLNAERGIFVKYEKDKDFTIISARNIQQENIQDITEFSSGLLQKVIDKKKPLLYHDVQSDPTVSQFESIQLQNIKSVIGVPVFNEGEIWGVILVDSKKSRKNFTEDSLIFLNFFSNLLTLSLERIAKVEKLQDENRILLNRLEKTETLPNMIGESRAIREVAKLIHKVAQTDATVLVLGESGTGKDLTAQAVHKLSRRKDKPYLAQFCGSIPDNLLESELFGYKKGAFTGANSDKKGLLEVADNGTFFLDEIADISSALQAKLLRVLENQEIMRLGDTQYKKVNVRIITATNKNLKQMSKEDKFREDLFYRLNVFPVRLPPLRERKEDIPLLADYFIKKFGGDHFSISKAGLRKLENYFWPGNVRQFINVIQRAIILSDDSRIEPDKLVIEEESDANEFKGTLKEFEIILLKKRLKECNGNRTLAAKSLGVSVRWVQNKLKEIDYQD